MNMNLYVALIIFGAISVVLVALNAFTILRYTLLAGRAMRRWVDFIPVLALATMVGHIAYGLSLDFLMIILAVPMYLATLLLFIGTLVRMLRRSRPVPAARKRAAKAAGALLCAALLLVAVVRQTEMYTYTWQYAYRFTVLAQTPGDTDLTNRSWSQAFAEMTEALKVKYPFTAWKRIDWDALYAEFAPRIADAEAHNNTRAYYHALREFAWRTRDPHVGVNGDDQGLAQAEVGGSYGLKLLRLDDGRLVVGEVTANGPATQSGMQAGAEIVTWNGHAAQEALAQTSIIWSEYPPATAEGIKLQQARFLGRGPVGSSAQVTFRNRGESSPRTATLTASAAEITETSGPQPPELIRSAVESRLLPSGYGYIRIKYELPTLLGLPDAEVQQAVADFAAADVPGIILDVRNNFGGETGITARLLAPFQPEERLYHYLGMLDPATQSFQPALNAPLKITPGQPQYRGRVAVLVDNYSHSAAEDIAYIVKDLPNGTVVGMSGTAGGGGDSEQDILLPGDVSFAFPKGQTLDDKLNILIEGDAQGNGGVSPDIRVPLDDTTVDALSAGRDVVLERAEAALREQIAVSK